MIRVYYANRLWGEYEGITPHIYLEIPDGSYIRFSDGGWRKRGDNFDLEVEDIPKETRLLDLLNSD